MYDYPDADRPSTWTLPAPPHRNRVCGVRSLSVALLVAWLQFLCAGDGSVGPAALAQEVTAQEVAAQDTAGSDTVAQDDATKSPYINAIELLPETTAGLVRVPNLPKFCDAFEQTLAGQLRDEELVKPFFDAQRERVRNYLQSVNNKIGITADDLFEIASGEVALAWLPFPNDKRRPYSLCLIADIRGRKDKAEAALATIDTDLKAGGWARNDVDHQGETVRVYNAKRKPGQIKVEQIAISLSEMRIVTADRDSVVTEILDAANGKSSGHPISEEQEFRKVITRAGEAIQGPAKNQGGTLAAEWFARPFAMGRIIREALDVDRGNDIDIIKLLENQGFDAATSAGGVVAINGKKYDLLHRGVILAKRPFEKAARILQFEVGPRQAIPDWVGPETASFNRLNLKIEEAFWASGTLIDEALGDEIFDDMIEGIHLDKDGPQIDLKNSVLPSLDNQIMLLTDNVLPADVNSERLLVAIRVRNADKIKTAIDKAMEVEPDASKMDAPELKNVDIWQVKRGEGGGEEDFDEELFGDLGFDEEETEEAPPLLDQWAIALIPQGPGSEVPYLMFSSHPELLIATAMRIQNGAKDGLASVPEVKEIVESFHDLGAQQTIFDRVVRTKQSMRVKYELLRQGKLRESSSVLAKLVQRLVEEAEAESGEPDPLNAGTLPPIAEIEKYLPNGGSYFEETQDGWEMTGFLLK